MTTSDEKPQIPTGRFERGGEECLLSSTGVPTPIQFIKGQVLLEDETVRKIIFHMRELNAQITRFKAHCFEDIGLFQELLAEEYGATIGGKKGNMTLSTFDTLEKVTIQISDRIDFGPEIHVAKALFDECVNDWASDSSPEVQLLVTSAFNTDKEGQFNRSEIFRLLRLDFQDERWEKAQEALRDAIRVNGSKTYIRGYERAQYDAPWNAITVDMAKA